MFRVMSNMSPVEWGMNKDIAIDYEIELGDLTEILVTRKLNKKVY
jgi:hypothetical protein